MCQCNFLRYLQYIVCAVCFLQVTVSAQAQQWDIGQLTALLAKTGASKARFTEKKFISTLERAIESSGELSYTPPDVIEKHTFKPKPETMRLMRSTLTLSRGKHRFSIDLDDSPELFALTESIRATLAGDRRALEFHYIVRLSGTRDNWSLELVPSHSLARQKIERITMSGHEGVVHQVEVLQADGDRSVMVIEKMHP